MKTSIILLAFNKSNFTSSAIKDLSQLPEDHEIILVDNASSDNTRELFEGNKRITYIRNEDNLGFSKGCNIGYKASSAENVIFLNNDIRVKGNFTDWTSPLIEKMNESECLVGPTMGQLDKELNFVQEASRRLGGNSYLSGWCLGGTKGTFDKLIINGYSGPFSEEFFCYFEDTDLSFRARRQGINMDVIDIPVVHFGKTSSKQLNVAKLYQEARKTFVSKWNGK